MKIFVFKIHKNILFFFIGIAILVICISLLVSNRIVSIASEVSMILSIYADAGNSENINKTAKLAIIIDDFGQDRAGVKEMMNINEHMTFAVMPFLEFSTEDARKAHENGYEVIVHLPMEPNYGKLSWLGPRPILAAMQSDEVKKIVIDSFQDVSYAVGANIHMGSKASAQEDTIAGVLDILKERNLYFVDSLTAAHHVSKKLSNQKGVVCYERDIFLDEQRPKAEIKEQLIKAGDIAKKRGYAIAIGHVGIEGGKSTAGAIAEMLPYFESKNIKLVYVSEL